MFCSGLAAFRSSSSLKPALVLCFRQRLLSSVAEAMDKIREGLKTSANAAIEKRIFIGTGQYYQHKTNERVVVLSLGTEEKLRAPMVLLDTTLSSLDVEKLEEKVRGLSRVLQLSTGEVDCVNDEEWKFGFEKSPLFSIFSTSGICCMLKAKDGLSPSLRIFDGPLSEDILLSDIKHVQVSLSSEPWNERKLELQLNNGDLLTVVQDFDEDESSDLGMLMMSTEWLVKAGAHLCLMVRQTLGGHSQVSLQLPNVLRAEVNPWVSLRHKAWAEETSKSH